MLLQDITLSHVHLNKMNSSSIYIPLYSSVEREEVLKFCATSFSDEGVDNAITPEHQRTRSQGWE